MGSCVSLHKTLNVNSKHPLWVGSKTSNAVLIQTPMNDQETMNYQHSTPQLLSQGNPTTTFQDSTSNDDMFFDSQAYLESDCEDFFSVHGDFTPSRGDSSIDQSSSVEVQPDSNVYLDRSSDSTIQPSPTDSQKKLVEFLHENFSKNLLKVEQVNGTPDVPASNSVGSREITPSRTSKPESSRLIRSVSCCLPRLPRSLSFGERKNGSAQTKASSFL